MTDQPDTTQEIASKAPEVDEGNGPVTITLSRPLYYAVFVSLIFALGLSVGYLLWGQPATPVETAQSPAQVEAIAKAAAQAAVATFIAEIQLQVVEQNGAAGEAQTPTNEQSAAQESAQDGTITRYDIPISDNDPTKGPDDAPVTIIEYSDFECPFCQRHALEVAPQLLSNYDGQIRYVFKDFPLESIHPEATPAAAAALCAHDQGAFWDFHDMLFNTELAFGQETYLAFAEELALDIDVFTQCVEEDRYVEEVLSDFEFAARLGVRSTPTFFINGIAVVGAQPYEVFAQVIDSELAGENQ